MRGRVTGLWTTAFVGCTPIGAVIVGGIAHSLGGRAALGIGAAGCLVAVLTGLLILRHMRPMQSTAPTQTSDLHVAAAVTQPAQLPAAKASTVAMMYVPAESPTR
jgi:hypothetical protein